MRSKQVEYRQIHRKKLSTEKKNSRGEQVEYRQTHV